MAYTPLTALNDYNSTSNTFAGKPVVVFDPATGITDTLRTIRLEGNPFDDSTPSMEDVMEAFWKDEKLANVTSICLGVWGEVFDESPDTWIKQFIEHADKLPALRAFFCGDIGQEDAELSWVQQTNLSDFLDAYPNLEVLVVRGVGFELNEAQRHSSLKHLTYETTGDEWESASIVKTLTTCSFPQLQHLELWINEKGAYDQLLSQQSFTNLQYLGVRNAYELDDFCADTLAGSPQLETLKVLDLSGGTLTDKGAQALLDNPAIKNLELLDLHHHYVTKEMQEKLNALGITVNLAEEQEPDDWGDDELHYYVMVSE